MIIDTLSNSEKYSSIHPLFAKAFEYIKSETLATIEDGKFDIDGDYLKAIVSNKNGMTAAESIGKFECHDKHIDIQLCIKGKEQISWKPRNTCTSKKGEYNPEKDVVFYNDEPDMFFQLIENQLLSSLKIFILLTAWLFCITNIYSQNTSPLKGSIERFKIHGKSLEGNLEGDSADRFVSIYLPPSYKLKPDNRYPVLYFLHGFTDSDAKFFGFTKHWMNLPPVVDSAFLNGEANEMIIVTPNADTKYRGSWYSNSITTGNWEDFVTKELVNFIDSHYRTIAKPASRGLAGHSMGGYGALRIGEKYPEIFSCIYLLSPALIMQSGENPINILSFKQADSIHTIADFDKASFATKIVFACAAAWSPNPANPPFYFDLPIKNGQLQNAVLTKWISNMPLTTIDQYIVNLKKLKAIAFDAGNKDETIDAGIKVLNNNLNKYGVKHLFEIYEGTHTDHIAKRIRENMLKFFSDNLSFYNK